LYSLQLVFNFSVHNQGQISKTISKNKNLHSLINTCCKTHFQLLRMALRSFIRHNTTEQWIVFIFLQHLEYKMTLKLIIN